MASINFQAFKQIADVRRDAIILVNTDTGNLQVKDNNVFNRAITWIRNRFSPDPVRQQTEREAAHNSFLRAVGSDIRYQDQAGWLQDQLGGDASLKIPLTTRRVREIVSEMNNRTTEAHRNSRLTAGEDHSREDRRAPDITGRRV